MSNFVVKYKNMYELLWRFKTELESIQLTSDLLKEYIAKYLDDGSMYGQTSEAMYSYFNEVHGGMLDSMKSIAQSLLDTIAGYKAGYYSIDASTNFVLPESNIDSSRERFNAIGDSFMEQYQKVNDTINGISDIVSYTCPDYQGIPDIHTSINNELPVLVDNVNEYEASTVTSLDGTIDPMIAIFMESLNSLFIPSAVSIDSYRSGSFGANGCVQAMMYMNDIMNEHHEEIEEFLTEVWDNETALRKQADDRITQGVWQIVGGVALVATGVVCIVFSAGAATPIVVTAWVAGGGTFAFGTAEMVEGGEHVYYGSIGDINSKTVNYVRDIVFFGDQKVYNITENIFSFAAGAMVPIAQSYKAAEFTLRSGGMILAKEAAGELAGWGATQLTGQVTDNRVIQLMSGIAASALTSKGIDKIDDYYNISRKPFINGMSDYDAKKYSILQNLDDEERLLYNKLIDEKFSIPEIDTYLFANQSKRLSIYYDAKLKKLYYLADGKLDDVQKTALTSDMKAFYDGTDVRFRGDIFVPESAEDIDLIYRNKYSGKYDINYNWKGEGTVPESRRMQVVKAGECFDRVGSPMGKCVGYIGEDGICATHQQRSLPYHFTESDIVQEPSYHLYVVEKDLTRENIIKAIDDSNYSDKIKANMKYDLDKYYENMKELSYGDGNGLAFGEIAPMFENTTGGTGGGFQYRMPFNMDQLKKLGMIKEKNLEKYFEKVN